MKFSRMKLIGMKTLKKTNHGSQLLHSGGVRRLVSSYDFAKRDLKKLLIFPPYANMSSKSLLKQTKSPKTGSHNNDMEIRVLCIELLKKTF